MLVQEEDPPQALPEPDSRDRACGVLEGRQAWEGGGNRSVPEGTCGPDSCAFQARATKSRSFKSGSGRAGTAPPAAPSLQLSPRGEGGRREAAAPWTPPVTLVPAAPSPHRASPPPRPAPATAAFRPAAGGSAEPCEQPRRSQ